MINLHTYIFGGTLIHSISLLVPILFAWKFLMLFLKIMNDTFLYHYTRKAKLQEQYWI